jgi:hypothetical protein
MRTVRLAIFTVLLIAPVTAFGSGLSFAALPAVIQVTLPEYWGAPDSFVFSIVALGIFGLLVRSKILRISSRNAR